METLKKIFSWMTGLSTVGKALAMVIVLLFLAIYFFCSCGTTHAVVRTRDSGTATISITTNNPTSVEASPNVTITIPKRDSLLRPFSR